MHPIFKLYWSNLQDEHIYKICLTHSIQMSVRRYIAHSIKEKEKQKKLMYCFNSKALYFTEKQLHSIFWQYYSFPVCQRIDEKKKKEKYNFYL